MTKKQKLSFYKELLRVVCKDHDTSFGYCYYMSSKMKFWYYMNYMKSICVYDDSEFRQHFPELYAYKPCGDILKWFPLNNEGWQKRIDILCKVISELEKEEGVK